MKIAYILRGLPGSGKTTLARHITSGGGAVHSTDDFFVEDGEYRFNPNWLPECHEANFFRFCRSLDGGVSPVVLDNTNSKREHFARYESAARERGYAVSVIQLPHPEPDTAAARTTHGVPAEIIKRILAEWEP